MAETVVREAVGVFHDEASLQNAVDELLIAGFDRSSLSLLASSHAVEEKLGHRYDKVAELEDDLSVPRTAYVGKDSRTEGKSAIISGLAYVGAIGTVGAIVASGGTVGLAILGAAAAGGVGGLVGAALARFMDRHHAHHLQDQLDRGGLLLWVATHDREHEARAGEILRRCAAEDVHVHDLPAHGYALEGGVSYDVSFMKRLGL
ncbi:MAG: hypothetical protein ACE5GS_00065 [Kiloniellaceae bacterium]